MSESSDSKHPPLGIERQTSLAEEEITLQLYQENISVTKQQVVTGQLKVERRTEEIAVPVSEELLSHSAEVEVTPVGKYVTDILEPREEDGMTIIPVYEEHVEIIKKIYLKEEVRIRRAEHRNRFEDKEIVKQQHIQITRTPTDK